jgi:hypothetical protein
MVAKRQPAVDRTEIAELRQLKHPAESVSMPPEMFPPSAPKYETRQRSSKSTRKSPETRKNRLAGSTARLRIPEYASAEIGT